MIDVKAAIDLYSHTHTHTIINTYISAHIHILSTINYGITYQLDLSIILGKV